MTDATQQLQSILETEQLDSLLFRGHTPPENNGCPRVFGGQVLAQALNSAIQTVPDDRLMHSMHAYFLRPGDVNHPILFEVDPIRDGGSFTTRRVVAKQHGKAIFNTSMSFKVPEEGLQHSNPMPDVPQPEELANDEERAQAFLRKELGTKRPIRADAFQCFDMRTVGELPFTLDSGHPPCQGFWFKPKTALQAPFPMHQAFLAYASDFRLMMTALLPHGMKDNFKNLIAASLDHSLWIHNPFDINDWLYYHMDGPVASSGCGLNFGHFYTRDGKIVASSSQEGLMRLKSNN